MALQNINSVLEAVIMASLHPINTDALMQVFLPEEAPTPDELKQALQELEDTYSERAIELKQVATGYRFQARQEYAPWVSRLWEEKAPRYSRALLETLVIIAYRQPITRAEIEDIRGVAVSTTMVKTLLEREWIREMGHRDVLGKPAIFGTTKAFLDYFNLKSLQDLPTLQALKDMDQIGKEFDKQIELTLVQNNTPNRAPEIEPEPEDKPDMDPPQEPHPDTEPEPHDKPDFNPEPEPVYVSEFNPELEYENPLELEAVD